MTNHARQMGIQSSLHMPDKVLNFVKDHFLMDSVIRSAPLLLKRSVRYTQIAVHKIQGMERAYDVLFIGTGTAHYTTTVHLMGYFVAISVIFKGKSLFVYFSVFDLLPVSAHKSPASRISHFHSSSCVFQMMESSIRPSMPTIRCTSSRRWFCFPSLSLCSTSSSILSG